jgi:hypothetical protein
MEVGMDYDEDERQAEANAEVASRVEADRIAALSFILANEKGRAFLWELLGSTNLFGSSFHPDTNTMAYNEGRRSVAAMLFADSAAIRPTVYHDMQREAAVREQRYHVITTGEDHE